MSNNRNLGNIATAITNATSGQVLTSQGNGVATFADAGGTGVTVHNNQAAMLTDAVSADEGSLHYETANNKLYVKQSSGFFLLASITNTAPTVSGFTETTGSGSANTILDNGTFALTSGSNTVITLTATDPDLETLVYSATVTSGTASNVISSPSLPISNQSGNTFTLTPVTSGSGGTITIRFDVSDGNNVVNKTHSFSIAFQVVDSNHTTLLATATSTGGNSTIEDSSTANSGNGHSITVNGDPYAGTFSPYRSGGYSTYFDGSGDWLELTGTALGNGNFTVEAWVWLDSLKDYNVIYDDRATGSSATGLALGVTATGAPYLYTNNGFQITSSQTCTAKKWHHISLVRSSGVITLYLDGTSGGTYSSSANFTDTNLGIGVARTYTVTSQFSGYMRDVRAVVSTAITPPSGGPTERLEAVTNTSLLTCHLPYISDGSTNDHSITVNGDPETKPFSPYDYEEYSATNHGGSVYFDGTGDTLEIPHSTNVGAFGTNDFTVQLWYYTEAIGSQDYLIDFRQYGGNGDYLSISKNGSNKIVVAEGGSNRITGTKNISVGQWFFITVHRDSGSLKLFVNGEQDGSTYSDSTNYVAGSSGNFIIGKNNGGASYLMQGYLSDIRVTQGSALDGTTVPTAPLSSSGASLHIKGTDASIIDKSQGANLKLVGNTTGSTDQVRSGDWVNTKTMKFDGSGDSIIADADAGNFGTGDFTIETWLRPSGWGRALFRKTTSTGSSSPPSISVYIASGSILTGVNSGTADGTWISGTNPFTLNTWGHLAITRVSGLVTVYANGSSIVSATRTADVDNDVTFRIGEWRNSTEYFSGYIQDFRITKGLARYTTSFTPPSAPLGG